MNLKILVEATVRRVWIACARSAFALMCAASSDPDATPANLRARYNLTGRPKGAWLGVRNGTGRKAQHFNPPSLFVPALLVTRISLSC